jgi:hypothetical protein
MYDIQGSRQELSHLRAVNASVKDIIDDSLGHLHEIHAVLRALEPGPLSPAVYVDNHPVCCGVPMWLTKMSIAEVSCGGHACAEYACQVCGKATTVMS